jgi:hypothetical protein
MKKLQMIILAMLLTVAYNVMVRANSYYKAGDHVEVYKNGKVYESVYYNNAIDNIYDSEFAIIDFLYNDAVYQIKNEYCPKSSCVSSAAMTIANVLGNDEIYSKHDMTYYSKLIGVTDNGTYMTNMKKIFDMDTNLVSNDIEFVNKDCFIKTIKDIIDKNGFIAVSSDLSKLKDGVKYYSHVDEKSNHCIVIMGYIQLKEELYYIISDPAIVEDTYCVESNVLFNSIYKGAVIIYKKDNK